jgi:DNA invertase Pin-like site-specific DNA recombinase
VHQENQKGRSDMTRVALYVRHSYENKNESSGDDQCSICCKYAEQQHWSVAGTYRDHAITESKMVVRPGIKALLRDAQEGKFDFVLTETLDQMSRNQFDVMTLFKHLHYVGVAISTLAEGEISLMHVDIGKNSKYAPPRISSKKSKEDKLT